ncbi:hypothetical protein STSP2_01414 [Anaerohalosphaera lusitana]|uniref:Uncharacterized protein n=1 Tax=Anaerohalosphaera lusitana TaxID=1936003 RepID=A0A1U9NKJ5_9BACT|nr:hypothetical protein STSP2_01414 [Anaerohalosphaera lusitana]
MPHRNAMVVYLILFNYGLMNTVKLMNSDIWDSLLNPK